MPPCAWCGGRESGAITDHQVCYSCGKLTYANGTKVPERDPNGGDEFTSTETMGPTKKKRGKKNG